ncbi:CoA-binding protein [bacterium]|nr:MAG: CoA-binding protein [bacterium]
MDNIKEKAVVVIGVSDREEKFGFRIFRDLLKEGFKVEGVNPRGGEVLGKKIYHNLRELGSPVDLVITVVPHEVTERVVEQCRGLGIKEIWMQPGSESERAINLAKEYGIKVVHNACFMVENGIW